MTNSFPNFINQLCAKQLWGIPSSLSYKTHFSSQLNYWSLICSWSIACRRCSNYIFILHLTPGLNILRKDNCPPRREIFKFWDFVRLILETLREFIIDGILSDLLSWWRRQMKTFSALLHLILNTSYATRLGVLFSPTKMRYQENSFDKSVFWWSETHFTSKNFPQSRFDGKFVCCEVIAGRRSLRVLHIPRQRRCHFTRIWMRK